MNNEQVPQSIVDRLRSNLRTAGIQFGEADLEGMVERGMLRTVLAFEDILEHTPVDGLPDYLAAWGEGYERAEDSPDEGVWPASFPGAVAGTLAPVFGKRVRADAHPTITKIADRLKARELSSVELTKQALARIAERDPELNAFQVVLADQALAAAHKAEQEIAAGAYRGPLHGVPVAAKDLLAMAGTATTAGSKILANWFTDFDAAAVERLRAAGAVIVGKTRMSEFAYSPGSNNVHYGPTRNPWNMEHDTGGSSSGSGASVAAGLVFAALGSDTGGSIRIPASLCGLVGLKPTYGRVSLYGAVTLSWSLDHLGPLTRSVADAAIMLAALEGYDSRDIRTRPSTPVDVNLDEGVRGLRIGVLGDDGSGMPLATPETLAAWRAGLDALKRQGAELVPIDLPETQALRIVSGVILVQEATAYHERSLRERPHDYGEFARQRLLAAYAYGPGAFVRAQQARRVLRRRFDAIFDQVDLLSTPTMPAGAPPLGVPAPVTFTNPFNALGWPAITVPVGLTSDRLPLGLQLAGKPWDDAIVLRAAHIVEAEGPWAG